MKLLQKFNENAAKRKLVEDTGAVGAGAVASCAMPLFSKFVARDIPKVRTIKWGKKKAVSTKKGLGLKEAYNQLSEAPSMGGDDGGMSMNMDGSQSSQSKSSAFDSSAVISKLKSIEDKDRQTAHNTTSFGLEDENGGIVRVTVNSEQSEEFEKALQAFLSQSEQNQDEIPEIAEVLFKLKDRFDIIDVQWPEVHEDEEEQMNLKDQEGQGDDGQDLDLDDGAGGDDMQGMDAPAAGADEGQVKDLLTQVIDMMKADADARKAEARAKEAEAKAKEADMIVKQVSSKVKQEEQFLDMEQHDKARKEEEKEVKRLAKLARWKHEMGSSGDDDQESDDDVDSMLGNMGGEPQSNPMQQKQAPAPREEEEQVMRKPATQKAQPDKKTSVIRGRVHPHDIASFILSRVK